MALPDTISAEAIAQAWMRCAAAHPTEPPEYRMAPDAAQIADVYARVMTYKLVNFDAASLSPKARDALERWLPAAAGH